MNKDEEVEQVGAVIDSWLDDIDDEKDVADKSDTEVSDVDAIIDNFAELAIIGMGVQPKDWNTKVLADVMFSKFSLLLENDEKKEQLFSLVPFALIKLFEYLGGVGILDNADELIKWVNQNKLKLQSLYNPKFDEFYQKLTEAMQKENVDTEDSTAVGAFTKRFLKENPELGRDLYVGKEKK